MRAAFEYQGQKCSALSRLYVPSSLWNNGFKDQLLEEVAKLKVGSYKDFTAFIGPVMYVSSFAVERSVDVSCLCSGRPAYDKIIDYIKKAREAGGEILIGGSGDDSKGYYVQPTVILTKDPKSVTMVDEIFGPVLTVCCRCTCRSQFSSDIPLDRCTSTKTTPGNRPSTSSI